VNSIDLCLLELIQIAEAPVYPAYRWLSRQLGRELPMAEFLRILAPLLADDVVRLWAVDLTIEKRSRWREIPSDLGEQYADLADLDDSFDPFGLSLTLGPAADLDSSPDWEVDFDFAEQHFAVSAGPPSMEGALQRIRGLFPDIDFVEENRGVAGDRIRITGSMTERTTARLCPDICPDPTTAKYDDLRTLDPPRELHARERALMEQLLSVPFVGRDEMRSQLATARVRAAGGGDTRTVRFKLALEDLHRACINVRVPVEAETTDEDGVPIMVLVHVVDGLLDELEIYRVDGKPIRREDLGVLQSVVVNAT
jgi:hypothetical protein